MPPAQAHAAAHPLPHTSHPACVPPLPLPCRPQEPLLQAMELLQHTDVIIGMHGAGWVSRVSSHPLFCFEGLVAGGWQLRACQGEEVSGAGRTPAGSRAGRFPASAAAMSARRLLTLCAAPPLQVDQRHVYQARRCGHADVPLWLAPARQLHHPRVRAGRGWEQEQGSRACWPRTCG